MGFIRTEVFQTVVQRRQVQIRVQDARSTLKLINRTKKMFVRRPACRVPVRHANLPGRQLGRTGCVWKRPFIYIASGVGVGPVSGFAGVCANALKLSHCQQLSCQQLADVLQAVSEPVGQLPGVLKRHWFNKKCDASERRFPLDKEFLRKVSPRASPSLFTSSFLGRKCLKNIGLNGHQIIPGAPKRLGAGPACRRSVLGAMS